MSVRTVLLAAASLHLSFWSTGRPGLVIQAQQVGVELGDWVGVGGWVRGRVGGRTPAHLTRSALRAGVCFASTTPARKRERTRTETHPQTQNNSKIHPASMV